MVMLYIKLNGITNAATLKQTSLPPEFNPLTQGIGSNGQLSSFSERHIAYKITRDREAAGSSLNSITVLCPLERTLIVA